MIELNGRPGYPEIYWRRIERSVFDVTKGLACNRDYPFVSAQVVADSIYRGKRITSIVIEAPRWILAEIDTHRVFSRSFASSRAIPAEKMLKRVRTQPVIPSVWGLNEPGMQSNGVASPEDIEYFRAHWTKAAENAVAEVEELTSNLPKGAQLHKQWANRLLEPFLTVKGIITSTEWDNFFVLRLHKDAQPEFRLLAQCAYLAMQHSDPRTLKAGQWHLPFIGKDESMFITDALKCSTARCARASYNNFDGSAPDAQKDFSTFDKLITSEPIHASPAEHQAQAASWWQWIKGWLLPWHRSNFSPKWYQYRKVLENDKRNTYTNW